MRKKILMWLLDVDDIDDYINLLHESIEDKKTCIREINKHLETLERNMEYLNDIRKLIKICKNHGIDVDKEINEIEL